MTASVSKHVKLTNIWILKTVPTKKRLIRKLVLECEDGILNTFETYLMIKM